MADFSSELDRLVPDVVRAAWQRARESWEDATAHDELLRLTHLHGCYAWVAARYRDAKADGAASDPIADRQRDRVRRAAEAALITSGAPRRSKERKPYQSTIVMFGLLILMIVVALVYAKYRRSITDDQPSPPVQTPQVR